MEQIVTLIDAVIVNFEDDEMLAAIAQQVHDMMADIPLFKK
jgi:glycine/serine hydroxymethyltransferase